VIDIAELRVEVHAKVLELVHMLDFVTIQGEVDARSPISINFVFFALSVRSRVL
jgi:hypothetical protein